MICGDLNNEKLCILFKNSYIKESSMKLGSSITLKATNISYKLVYFTKQRQYSKKETTN